MAVSLAMTVNGKPVSADVDPRTLLVEFLRDSCALTGTHVGCDTAQCGACTVHLDGRAVKSCNDARRCRRRAPTSTTIEGLIAEDGTLHPMQAAFRECHGLQCGFCTPGMVMSAIDLVKRTSAGRRGDDPRRARRQHLPLHRLPQHRQGGAAGRRRDGQVGDDDGRERYDRPWQRRSASRCRRKEDARFLTGAGQYTDDVDAAAPDLRVLPALAARARDDPLDRHREGEGSARRRRDLHRRRPRRGVNGLPCGWLITGTDGKPMNEPPHPVLAQGKVRHVGDQVALVVAETLDAGEGRRRADRRRLRRAAGGRRTASTR